MRAIYVVLFLVFSVASGFCGLEHIPPPPGLPLPNLPADFDLLDGRLTLTLFPERGLIEGKATLWGKLYGSEPHFPFQLHSRAQVPHLSNAHGRRLKGMRAGHRMDVLMPIDGRRPRHLGIVVKWLVKVGGPSQEGPLTPFLCSHGAFLPSDLLWHPRGIGNDRATWQLMLRMPPDWRPEGLGREQQRFMSKSKICYRFRMDTPVLGMGFAAGPFEQSSRRKFYGGVVRSLVPTGKVNSTLAGHTKTLVDVLNFNKRLLGSPVFERYSLIHMPYSVPELPYRIASEQNFSIVASPPQAARGPYLEALATELARMWFGERVRFRDSLGEALCVYMGMLAVRKFDNKKAFLMSAREKARRYQTAAMCNRDARISGIKGLGENIDRGTYEVVVRNKAPLLLLCMEQACGGVKPFMRLLKKFTLHHHEGTPADWSRLLWVYEKESGIDMSNFALLYIDGPGLPPDTAGRVGYSVLPDEKVGEGRAE